MTQKGKKKAGVLEEKSSSPATPLSHFSALLVLYMKSNPEVQFVHFTAVFNKRALSKTCLILEKLVVLIYNELDKYQIGIYSL